MSAVKIKFAHSAMRGTMYIRGAGNDIVPFVRAALKEGKHYSEESAMFYVPGISQDAADEVFDLTNNPGRQDERELIYGRGRSLSVGDIVEVYNPDFSVEQWLCCSVGWKEITE